MKSARPFPKLVFGILLIGMGAWIILAAQSNQPPIMNYNQCIAAGGIPLKTYPATCEINGKTFTQAVSEVCRGDYECGPEYFCRFGVCTEFVPEKQCEINADCTLIDTLRRFDCCPSPYCDGIDYSKPEWKAVNANWFTKNHTQYCSKKEECGPTILCATQIVNDFYYAACLNGTCQKSPKKE